MNISAQSFSFITHIASEELIFNIFFLKFSILVGMTTKQIDSICLVDSRGGPVNKHFEKKKLLP